MKKVGPASYMMNMVFTIKRVSKEIFQVWMRLYLYYVFRIIFSSIAPAGFAGEPEFWGALLCSGLFGVVMGFVGLAFLNVADHVPKEYVNNGAFNEASDADFYAGKKYWILVTGGAGLLVGLVR